MAATAENGFEVRFSLGVRDGLQEVTFDQWATTARKFDLIACLSGVSVEKIHRIFSGFYLVECHQL